MNDLNALLNPQPVAAVPAAPVPATTLAPAVAVATTVATPVPAIAPAVVAAPIATVPVVTPPAMGVNLNGGSNLADLRRAQLAAANIGSNRNDVPLGTGWYVLKSGTYKLTRNNKNMTNMSVICILALKDKDGLSPGTSGYTGPIVGQEYSTPLWLDGDFAISKNLRALQAIMGWTTEKAKGLQATVEGQNKVLALIDGLTCFNGAQPTGKPCIFSNQAVVQLKAYLDVYDIKVNGEVSYDKDRNVLKGSSEKVLWEKKIYLKDLSPAGISNEVILAAFGSPEAVQACNVTEQGIIAWQ